MWQSFLAPHTTQYRSIEEPLSREMLHDWHRMLMRGHREVRVTGAYRTHPEPMQVLSGPVGHPRIHFEAPPPDQVEAEMERFINWFNDSRDLPALQRSGLAHLHLISIHPFEDGNGRIARAISEKALAQTFGESSLTALSSRIESERKEYYRQLELANKGLGGVGMTGILLRGGSICPAMDARTGALPGG